MKNEMDMLNGSLWGKIIRFSLPIVMTGVLQQLFNSADTLIVGRFGASGALAAVGTNGETVAMFVSASSGLATGANVLISRMIGAGEKERVPAAVRTSIFTAPLLGLVMTLIGEALAAPLLAWIHTPREIFANALLYLRIYLLAVPFVMLYDFGAAVLRAKGDSKRPLAVLTLSGAINVALNLVFVIGFGMDVAGVALATVLSSAFSAAIVTLLLIAEKGEFRLCAGKLRAKDALSAVRIGVPAALQGAVFCFANVFVQASVNTFGAGAVAGSAIAMTFEYFTYYAITAPGQAATTFIAQNYAARRPERCRKTLYVCLILSFCSCAAMTVPLSVFRNAASGLFSAHAAEVEQACTRILFILAFEPICSFYEIPAGALRGLGYSAAPAVETILGTCLFRIVWIFTVFAHFRTLQSLYVVFPITWVVTSLLVCGTYLAVQKKMAKKAENSLSPAP